MSSNQAGLTSIEARILLASGGANAVDDVAQHPARRVLLKLWAPVPWMLEAAILLQIGIGDYTQAGVVTVLLVTNAALGFFQEGRAQATLDALKSRLALIAAVRRDGVWTTAPASSLVLGDLIKLSLGAVVPADYPAGRRFRADRPVDADRRILASGSGCRRKCLCRRPGPSRGGGGPCHGHRRAH